MNCEQFEEKVSPMIDGRLSAKEKDEFIAHGAECTKCNQCAAEIEKVDALLKAHPLPKLPPELVQRLKEIELAETIPEVPWGPYVLEFLAWAFAAAAVLLFSMLEAGFWKEAAMTLIPAVGWAAVLVRINMKKIIPPGFSLQQARRLSLANQPE